MLKIPFSSCAFIDVRFKYSESSNGDLLQEDLSHTLCLPGLLLPETPVPAAGHCQPRSLQETLKHSQAGLAQSLVGGHCSFTLGPDVHKLWFVPPRVSGGYWV